MMAMYTDEPKMYEMIVQKHTKANLINTAYPNQKLPILQYQ